ncbi:MAG: 16S rRNA (guanine(966)-N(2))-methyltransferase RsmD [Anaerolineaceae bacterium 4572_32.1]|nr:MAG: 16S rRNA (guanine(966)-N(2))-methyltransferase RsmD [Anaerolineaceae bacterium 4572_32.1]
MRVISGQAKGRKLRAVPGNRTRPITDRVKEALFNILMHDVVGTRFLDLFAGTGSVGIEALSRGAECAVFVEQSRAAVQVIRYNLKTTRLADRARVLKADVFSFLNQPQAEEAPFDLIYIAPPQYEGLWANTLHALDIKNNPLLSEHSLIIVQIYPKEYTDLALTRLELIDQRNYGSTQLCFYQSLI